MNNSLVKSKLQVNNIEISYHMLGSGPNLILLHGALGTGMFQWGKCIKGLAENFTVYVPDLRGHGQSTNPSNDWTSDQMIEDIRMFIEALEIKAPIICGWSLGGAITLHLALSYPNLGQSYILGGITGENETIDYELGKILGIDKNGKVSISQLEAVQGNLVDLVKSLHTQQDKNQWIRVINGWGSMFVEEKKFDYSNAESIKGHVMILVGDQDPTTSVEMSQKLSNRFNRSSIRIIPGGNHSLTITHSQDIVDMIKELYENKVDKI
jgi:pimeloyl-ACP methyl ester carboxylesterase